MHDILIIGAGNIGSLIAYMLATTNDYRVTLADAQENNPHVSRLGSIPNLQYQVVDAKDTNALANLISKNNIKALISSLPYYCNVPMAKLASEKKIHYFDLTEDVETTNAVQQIATQSPASAFVPQCGLAPGFISIVANHLMCHFSSLDAVKLRVGALPTNISNALQYSLTWSTDGLINEYGNLCNGVEGGQAVELLPLEGLEEIKIDGLTYEAFNTSGGIGSLAHSYKNKVRQLSYKTIRYPGHCAKIKFLMNDLGLNQDRDTLKRVLEKALPKTYQDVVLVYVSVTGHQDEQLLEENYVKKFYPARRDRHRFSAIQMTTASGLCSVVDLVFANQDRYHGFIKQEQFSFTDLLNNRFGEYYR